MKLVYMFEAIRWNARPVIVEKVLRQEIMQISDIYDSLSRRKVHHINDAFVCRDSNTFENLVSPLDGGSFMNDKSFFLHPVEVAFFEVIEKSKKKSRTIDLNYAIYGFY